MPDIVLEGVSKFYKKTRRERREHKGRREVAIEDVDLTISQGEFVFIVGSRGSGKSTLLRLISGNLKPDQGTVYLGGYNLDAVRLWDRSRIANIFGQVWQEPTLMRKRTVEENLEIVAVLQNWLHMGSRKSIQERINKVLGLVGMSGANNFFPVELSGGEVRRIELARALINSPSILILDEITNNLDDDNIWDIFHLLKELNERGTTIIMATHASRYVNIMHRRVVTLVDGHIYGDVRHGKYGDVF